MRRRLGVEGLELRRLLAVGIAEFPVPTAVSGPLEIAAGPDGNLWFTEYYGGQIGAINPTTHAIQEFPTPTAGSGPEGIAAGPDGNLWFTEGATNQIGQFTKATTATQLVSSANPSTFGQAVTFTATVAPALGAGTPTGTVTFTFDGQRQAPVPLAMVNGADQATLTLRSLPAGAHTIAAIYDGDPGFSASTAAPLTQTVNPAATTTTLVAAPNPSTVGQALTFIATITATGGGTPSGSVTFTLDGQPQAPVALSVVRGADQATFTTAALAAGPHTVTAAYGGDANFAASTASPLTQTVNAQTATTAIDAGGGAAGPFAADTGFSGGTTYSNTDPIDTRGVTNPAPQAVYDSERYGDFTYTIPNLTPGAGYTVRLHFAEIWWNAAGRRAFDVSINGSQVLSQFDIFAAAGGKDIAIVKQFTTTADGAGTIAIQFATVKDNAKISGIEIIPTTAIDSTDTIPT